MRIRLREAEGVLHEDPHDQVQEAVGGRAEEEEEEPAEPGVLADDRDHELLRAALAETVEQGVHRHRHVGEEVGWIHGWWGVVLYVEDFDASDFC